MSKNEEFLILHDRATRGLTLTDAERRLLEGWYATEDIKERAELDYTVLTTERQSKLEPQVRSAIARLPEISQRIEKLIEENEILRSEIAQLQKQLADREDSQAA